MDPNEALETQRDLVEELCSSIVPDDLEEKVSQLSESVMALDEWIMKGGFLPEEWEIRCNGGALRRVKLALQVYEEALAATETFDGDLATYLAYLFPAILKGSHIDLHLDNIIEDEVHQYFTSMFSPDHPVWGYIKVSAAEKSA